MDTYAPEIAPQRSEWLALDEHERLLLVEQYHARAQITLPNARLHAVMHTIIENQLAESVPEVVAVMERLQREGLSRHDALHAIGSVLAPHLAELLQTSPPVGDAHTPYFAALQELTAARWRAS